MELWKTVKKTKKCLSIVKLLASAFTKEHLERNDGSFTIQSYGKGKYGRVLAEIFIDGEEKSLNQLLIENGHAYVYEGGTKQVFKG